MIHNQMQLKAKKPAHRVFAFLSEALENLMSFLAFDMAYLKGCGINIVMVGFLTLHPF
jgi:hypothetical protein